MSGSRPHRLKTLREEFPVGCMVELIHMDDTQAPPAGSIGRVLTIDDIGTIHVAWKNGSTLGIVPGVDMIKRLSP
jgi:hypothetical protein